MPRPARETPWLERRNGGRFYAYWYDPEARETKRLSLRTSDKDEARDRFAAFLLEGEAITKPRGADELTVARALDDYLKEHVNRNCAAPDRQEFAIKNLKAGLGETAMADVDVPMCRRYAQMRREGDVGGDRFGHRRKGSDSTIRRELNVLRAAANHAIKWRRLPADKSPSIELPEEHVIGADDEAPYFTKDEIALLIDVAEGELRHFIELAYWTGARRASITHLDRSQIRWKEKRILLQKPGKKATKKRQPIVPILPEMESSLKAMDAAAEAAGRERLFSGLDFYRRFKTLCKSLGFGDRDHPHLLRHSRATHLLQDNKSLYSVARLLGDTVATVERVYGHHSAEHLAEHLSSNSAPVEAAAL